MKHWRTPIGKQREAMIKEMADKLNDDALLTLSRHNVLDACIDRAYTAMFPDRKVAVKRKVYIKIEF